MAAVGRFKHAIAKQLSLITTCCEPQILQAIRTPPKKTNAQFAVSLAKLAATLRQDPNVNLPNNPSIWCKATANKIQANDLIATATADGSNLNFGVQQTEFTKQVLQEVYHEKTTYGWAHIPKPREKPTVVIDYSSPNIAKPFHAGHLRSTIMGNFAKRIHQAMNYKVVGINYLGDWGKQYGLLAVGFERYGDEDELKKNPIHHLYDVYVKINVDAREDPEIDRLANAYFKRMEEGDEKALLQWRRFRNLSIESYTGIYDRLDIQFDMYSGESQIHDYIPHVYQHLQRQNLLTKTDDGAYAVDLEKYNLGKAMIQRADGTSLYLTRDLASLLMRRDKFKFSKALYAVGVEQEGYFKQLFKVAELMFPEDAWAKQLQHVGFGRINGMSTRKGTAVFLQDILDAAQDKIMDYMRNDTAKYELIGEDGAKMIADQLGVSAILIQDMKSKRNKNYTFSWDRMTDARGDTGVFLQYAHARACGIERKAEIDIRPNCDFDLLKEDEAFELVQMISQFPEQVEMSFTTLEPCTLVNYLFKLSHATSLASHSLRVKGSEPSVAEARMLLFWAARTTLHNGLSLLGIRPLEQM
ncbi:arginyl-tRNA synthetase [Radiomyces spectabilis]|uniref:arginyl-tRNA synthetase n=1 Tax=Radiomyces spectabilis TaxID=64574 RepID=UPI00221F64EF|nr:arginyl-tRNA synthetase [Radiomyces spectabilis]KAI8393331.1 arginyl-tRNA synthetase [Radiomyces spectabilis]